MELVKKLDETDKFCRINITTSQHVINTSFFINLDIAYAKHAYIR